jgi:hypothetical protein
MQRVSRVVDSSVGYGFLSHCDQKVAMSVSHILGR